MSKKDNKIILISTLGIIGTIIIVLGVTYAYWRLTKEQGGVNIVNSACLNVTMENQANDINLENAYPIVDSDGLKLEPFTFTLKNNCEEYADYTISLEMLSVTDLNSDFVKVALNEEETSASPKKLSSYDEYEDLKLQDTIEGRTITSGKLEPNSEKNYELRIWLDEDVTVDDDVMNKIYKSKVVIESTIGEGPKPATEYLIEKEKEEQTKEEPELMYDDTEDRNLRYVGANPNNYIDIGDRYKSDIAIFNDRWEQDDTLYDSLEACEEVHPDYGCEVSHKKGEPILWRIIGVMKNVYNVETGKQEDLIKIIRADSIGSYSWDTSAHGVNEDDYGVNDGYGVNEWSQADLMKLLNPNYDNNQDDLCQYGYEDNIGGYYCQTKYVNNSLYWNNESGQCYFAWNKVGYNCDFTNIGISDEAKNKIAKVRWNTGTFATYDTSEWTASATYMAERSENNGKQYCVSKGCGSNLKCNACNDDIERTTTWDGYIGLIHPSDYGYAVGKSVKNVCLTKSMYYYDGDGCYKADWLTPVYSCLSINPVPTSGGADAIFNITERLDTSSAGQDIDIYPVAYLKSSVSISEASGTPEDPFIAS